MLVKAEEKVFFDIELFDLKINDHSEKLLKYFNEGKIKHVVDEIEEQIRELLFVDNPEMIFENSKMIRIDNKIISIKNGIWVFFPWKDTLVHCLDEVDFKRLKINRNLNLITSDEQTQITTKKIGIVGLNVGNPGAVCMALTGLGNFFKISDLDPLSVSNLNRFRAGICDLGINKSILTGRQMLEINPFLKIDVLPDGISVDTIDSFLSEPKIDILVEEMDNLKLKILMRERAKHFKIPVLMVTGNAENVIIDVERYDQDNNLEIMNGLLSKEVYDSIENNIKSVKQKIELARDFMGIEVLDKKLIDSFSLVGKTLAGIPQLAESSFMRGAAICYFARKILYGENIKSGRYHLKIK